ncbi:MAG: STN domain-containing protein [Planctomycetota bacterium]|nr:STN domain-containing protein [Planctomycetota bacterium]
MRYTFLLIAALAFSFAVIAVSPGFAQEGAKEDTNTEASEDSEEYSPKIEKWLSKELHFESKGWQLDTIIAVCAELTGASIRFELGHGKKKMPKLSFKATGETLEELLDKVLAVTDYDWLVKGDTIRIVKRQY